MRKGPPLGLMDITEDLVVFKDQSLSEWLAMHTYAHFPLTMTMNWNDCGG